MFDCQASSVTARKEEVFLANLSVFQVSRVLHCCHRERWKMSQLAGNIPI